MPAENSEPLINHVRRVEDEHGNSSWEVVQDHSVERKIAWIQRLAKFGIGNVSNEIARLHERILKKEDKDQDS